MTSLCATCKNVREVRTTRSLFLLCELSLTDRAFVKYPPQPVVRCGGYQAREGPKEEVCPVKQTGGSEPPGLSRRG
jgi:hypothetical protein